MGDARTAQIVLSINNAVQANNDNYQFIIESQHTDAPEGWIINATIKAKADSPVYRGGSIRIKIVLPKSYPFDPPLVYFLNRVFHPNVDEHGQVCSEFLQSDDIWSEDEAFIELIKHLTDLLDTPDLRFPIGAVSAALYSSNRTEYIDIARATYQGN